MARFAPRTANLAAGQKRAFPGGVGPMKVRIRSLKYIRYFLRIGVARSLLITGRIHRERPPVYSVTSEAATNVSFQSAPPRAAQVRPNRRQTIVSARWSTATPPRRQQLAPPRHRRRPHRRNPAPTTLRQPRTTADRQTQHPPTRQPITIPSNQRRFRRSSPPTPTPTPTRRQPSKAKSGGSKSDDAKSDRQSQRPANASASTDARRLDAARTQPNDGDAERRRDRDPRCHRGDCCSGRCRLRRRRRQCHGAAGDRGGSDCRQPSATAPHRPLRRQLPTARSAQPAIGCRSVIAEPTATAADAKRRSADGDDRDGRQTSTGQPTAAPVKPQTDGTPRRRRSQRCCRNRTRGTEGHPSKTAAATQAETATATSAARRSRRGATDPAGRDRAAGRPPPARRTASSSTVDAAKTDAAANPSLTSVRRRHTVHERRRRRTGIRQPMHRSRRAGAGAIGPQLPSATTNAAPAASLSVTAATNAPVPLSGLALEIAASAKSGKSRFEIRLDPADLGRIDVRIDVDRNGQVTSHLTVEKPETLSMLRQDAPQLQQRARRRRIQDRRWRPAIQPARPVLVRPEQRQRRPAAMRSGWWSAKTTPIPPRSRDEPMAACSDRAAASTSGSEETDMTTASAIADLGRFGHDAAAALVVQFDSAARRADRRQTSPAISRPS